MAVKELTTAINTPLGTCPIPPVAGSLALNWEAPSVAVDGVQFSPVGNELILIRNSAASPGTFTVTSVADEYGRKGDITAYSIVAVGTLTASVVVLPLKSAKLFTGGTTAGKILITMSAVTIEVAIIRLPYGL